MALPLVLALLSGCDPHDATVSGKYAMYFAARTSSNIDRVQRTYDPVDCEYEQTDPLAKEIDDEQVFEDECWKQKIEAEKVFQDDYGLKGFDCRTFGDAPYNGNSIRIRDAMTPGWESQYEDFCCAEANDDDPNNDPDGDILTANDCTVRKARYMSWLDDKAFYLSTGEVQSWREEALLTSEGDLQLTIHTTTPFGDVRFGWVIKPKFQPTECVDVDGVATERPTFDDDNWIDGWSNTYEEDDGYTVYLLNAGATQVNPNNNGDYWYLDRTWLAGASFSRFGDEDAYMYTTDYADWNDVATVPFWVGRNDEGNVVSGYPLDESGQYRELNCGEGGDGCSQVIDYADFVDVLKDNFNYGGVDRDEVRVEPADNEFQDYGMLPQDEFPFATRIEDNSWRTTAAGDGTTAEGMDGWSSVSPNYVRFKASRDEIDALEVGTLDSPLEGDFQLLFYSSDSSGSVWAFTGSFSIDKIGEDVWGPDAELNDIKEAENETPACGE